MKRLMTTCLFVLFAMIFIPSTLAIQKTGHINLLAVSSEGNNETGSVADLYLEIKPGTGRVFLDTYPLTRIDTQFATRFANSIACEYAEIDCKSLDFFYTINSRSAIVGGPSAGAATTILTISMLEDAKIPQDIAVTGTINSGGIIGPIAGVEAKVKAAINDNLKTVLIPTINVGNLTEIEAFLDSANITVVRVSSIDDAMYSLTGKRKGKNANIDVSPVFTNTMKEIADILCNATKALMVNGTNTTYESRGMSLYKSSINASLTNSYYSEASFCFGANVQFRDLDLSTKTNSELIITFNKIKNDIDTFEKNVDNIDIKTIDDLQTYMIVKERINDAKDYILTVESNGKNLTNLSSDSIAYSIERYNSALTWARFFGTGKKEYVLDKESQRNACADKISEVQGYIQYISLYIDTPLTNVQSEVDDAVNDLLSGDYPLCISKASKAKAETGIILEALSISGDQMRQLLDQKLEIAKQSIISEQEKGVFPILSYSYYEYAKTLKDSDPNSAIIYVGYSIELSNLDVFFEKKDSNISIQPDYSLIVLFSLGILIGMIIMLALVILLLKIDAKRKGKRIDKKRKR